MKRALLNIICAVVPLCSYLESSNLFAQGQGAPATVVATETPTSRIQELLDRQQQVKLQLVDAAQRAGLVSEREGPARELISKEGDLLSRINLSIDQLVAEIRSQENLKTTQNELRSEAELLARGLLPDEVTDAFSTFDRLRSELVDEESHKEKSARALTEATKNLDRAESQSSEKEKKRREIREKKSSLTPVAATGVLDPELRVAELAAELAALERELAEEQLKSATLISDNTSLRIANLSKKVEILRPKARLTPEVVDEKLNQIEKQELVYRRDLDSAKLDAGVAEKRLGQVRQRIESVTDTDPILSAEMEARRLAFEYQQLKISSLGEWLERLQRERDIWQKRLKLASQRVPSRELRGWESDNQDITDRITSTQRLKESQIDESRKSVAALKERIASVGNSQEILRWLKEQEQIDQDVISLLTLDLTSVRSLRILVSKLTEDIHDQQSSFRFSEFMSRVLETATGIWRYELFATSDDFPITISKVVLGALLLFLGYFLSKGLSSTFSRWVLSRFKLSRGGTSALQSLVFYILVVMFAFAAMRMVNIPLTLFTVIGGALAIGVGFGSQNIMNNFISGLIVLIEGRIRIGDVITGTGFSGIVSHIGTRSSTIRTGENTDIIIPNSMLLEKDVTNWTLIDNSLRRSITLSVPSGALPEVVRDILRMAANENPRVQRSPEPVVLITSIGTAGYEFELLFWMTMASPLDIRVVESSLRFRIAELLREHGVALAAVQKDVVLSAPEAIPVRVESK